MATIISHYFLSLGFKKKQSHTFNNLNDCIWSFQVITKFSINIDTYFLTFFFEKYFILRKILKQTVPEENLIQGRFH